MSAGNNKDLVSLGGISFHAEALTTDVIVRGERLPPDRAMHH